MFRRQRTGSVVCTSCGTLVGVQDDRCLNCGRWNPGLWGYAPVLRRLGQDLGFVQLVLWGCVGLYVVSLLLSGGEIGMAGPLQILAPQTAPLVVLGASGAIPVFGLGRWWTVLSAGWLHGGVLHILFNMLWVRQLGPAVADLYGPGRLVIVYTISSVCGFTFSSVAGALLPGVPILGGAAVTVGASAAIFGLLGALVYYGRRTGSRLVHSQAVTFAVVLFIFGLIMPRIDNYAHAGGFIGGYLSARWLDPLRPERIDHLLIALICVVLTALAIVVSVIHGLPLLLR